jgi:hypothetical protein
MGPLVARGAQRRHMLVGKLVPGHPVRAELATGEEASGVLQRRAHGVPARTPMPIAQGAFFLQIEEDPFMLQQPSLQW